MKKILFASLLFLTTYASAQAVWTPDLGNGKYKNPIVFADYSDPDVIRTGDDYWMTASSFNCVPGLPVLHSTDLVNWELVNYALPRMYDTDFDAASHGNGVWAPAIRFHDGWYYIYWGDPDRGIYMVRTQDPRGAWSKPVLVKAAKGIIDTCPLWDEDGRAYLVHGWAGSRAGFKSVLSVSEMTPDGTDGKSSCGRNRRGDRMNAARYCIRVTVRSRGRIKAVGSRMSKAMRGSFISMTVMPMAVFSICNR